MVLPWVNELSAVIASSTEQRSSPRCEVRFHVNTQTFGVELSTGAVTDGSRASSEIKGDQHTFELIMSGQETLQSAYRAGLIELSGDPEPFLRLAIALDRLMLTQVSVQ